MKQKFNTEVKEIFGCFLNVQHNINKEDKERNIYQENTKQTDNKIRQKRSSPPPGNPSATVWANDVGHGVPTCSWAPVGEVHWACAHISRKLLGF